MASPAVMSLVVAPPENAPDAPMAKCASGHCLVIRGFNQCHNILGSETKEQVVEFTANGLNQGASRSFAVLRIVYHCFEGSGCVAGLKHVKWHWSFLSGKHPR
jgi:hypothetical protein